MESLLPAHPRTGYNAWNRPLTCDWNQKTPHLGMSSRGNFILLICVFSSLGKLMGDFVQWTFRSSRPFSFRSDSPQTPPEYFYSPRFVALDEALYTSSIEKGL